MNYIVLPTSMHFIYFFESMPLSILMVGLFGLGLLFLSFTPVVQQMISWRTADFRFSNWRLDLLQPVILNLLVVSLLASTIFDNVQPLVHFDFIRSMIQLFSIWMLQGLYFESDFQFHSRIKQALYVDWAPSDWLSEFEL